MAAPTTNNDKAIRDVVSMPPTVGGAVRTFHPQRPPLARCRATFLADVARELGCSEASAEKRCYGDHAANLETAKIIRVRLRRGEGDEAATLMAPIEAEIYGEPTGLIVEAILAAAMADCSEDCEEARYVANPCAATAKAWVRASSIERQRAEAREVELIAKWEL